VPVIQIDVNATADGDNTVIAAPAAGLRIEVLSYHLTNNTATAGAVLFKSGANTIGRTHLASNATNPVISQNGKREVPVFICNAAEAFIINTTAGQDVVGHLTYIIRSDE
jgi:hypothetical protein